MGLWNKLLGERETSAQRLGRARQHVDDGEFEVAVHALAGIDGSEADEIRQRARNGIESRAERPETRNAVKAHGPDLDDPLLEHGGPPYREPVKPRRQKQPKQPKASRGELVIHGIAADGSTTYEVDGTAIKFNAPVDDDDGRPRSTDGLDVAHRLIESVRAHDLDARAFAFVDAALLAARAEASFPAMADPRRQAILDLTIAASTGDSERVVAAIRTSPPEAAEAVAHFATPIGVRFAARALGELAKQGLVSPQLDLIAALATIDPATCARLVDQVGGGTFAGEALLIAVDAGSDVPGLEARWRDWESITDREERTQWLALAVRRAARRDLEEAIALEQRLPEEDRFDYSASLAVAARLAKADGARAIAIARERSPDVDHAGWLVGCVRGGAAGASELLDIWIDALGPLTYDPFTYFSTVLAASIELGDVERTRRCLTAAGATGWQVACAAREALAIASARGDGGTLLAACYERHTPAVVAGRAIACGAIPFGAGKMVLQPAWLDFIDPQPIETLAIVAALGASGPCWMMPRLP